jgi:hypothetical protein
MVPVRNAIIAHAKNFVLNDKLPLALLKAFVQSTRSLHATRNAWCFILWLAELCLSLLPTAVLEPSPLVNTSPHRARYVQPSGDHLLCHLYFQTVRGIVVHSYSGANCRSKNTRMWLTSREMCAILLVVKSPWAICSFIFHEKCTR